jgi:hypothetical protein
MAALGLWMAHKKPVSRPITGHWQAHARQGCGLSLPRRLKGKDQNDFFSASGKLVAREVGNLTYANGKAVYRGRLGLVVLGQDLK